MRKNPVYSLYDMNWIYFLGLAIAGYVGIAIYNRAVGSADSFLDAIYTAFQPVPFTVMVAANIILGVAVYYGFLATSSAIPVLISAGVIVTFAYSVVAAGVTMTFTKLLGIALIIAGIYLLQ